MTHHMTIGGMTRHIIL